MWCRRALRPGRGLFATRELVGREIRTLPSDRRAFRRANDAARSLAPPRPDPLRASDAPEDAGLDRDDSADDDLAFHVAITEPLFVVAPLPVPVEELADRRVPPIDDVDAVRGVDEGGAPDQNVALDGAAPAHLLAQAKV